MHSNLHFEIPDFSFLNLQFPLYFFYSLINNLRHLQSLVSLISVKTFGLTGAITDVEALDI